MIQELLIKIKIINTYGNRVAPTIILDRPTLNLILKPTDKAPREYLKYTTVAFQMAALIGLCAYVGDLIDSCYQHATPWVTVLGCIIGVALSIYQVIRTLK